MKKSSVVATVVMLHIAVIGLMALSQGCGRTSRAGSADIYEAEVLPAMPPATQAEPVFVPSESVVPEPNFELPRHITYDVKKGDSLSVIAHRHHTTARAIADLNGLTDMNKIRIGQQLLVPAGAAGAVESQPEVATAAPKTAVPPADATTYEIQKGDCLSSIAAQFGTTVRELRNMNNMTSDTIRAGKKIFVPRSARSPQATVKPAGSEPVKPAEQPLPIIPNEPIVAPTEEKPVTGITEPVETAPATESSTSFIPHEVEAGETLDSIAVIYGVSVSRIMSFNKLSGNTVNAGTILKIPSSE